MKNHILLAIGIAIIIFSVYSCSSKKPNCEIISQAFLTNDEQTLKNEINKICSSYKPFKSGGDEYGQEKNFSKITQSIAGECDIKVTDACYLCLPTNPPISTFKLSITVDTQTVTKTIQLAFTPYNRFQYKGIID